MKLNVEDNHGRDSVVNFAYTNSVLFENSLRETVLNSLLFSLCNLINMNNRPNTKSDTIIDAAFFFYNKFNQKITNLILVIIRW